MWRRRPVLGGRGDVPAPPPGTLRHPRLPHPPAAAGRWLPRAGASPPQASHSGAAPAGQVLPGLQGNRSGKVWEGGVATRSSERKGDSPEGARGAQRCGRHLAGRTERRRTARRDPCACLACGQVVVCGTGDQGTGPFAAEDWA